MTIAPIQILLVDDNPADVDLAREALEQSRLHLVISVAKDGIDASDFLYKRGPYADAPTPDMILLDLNLPRKNGRELLSEIKKDARLKRIPVVVLSSSDAEKDIVQSYDLGANSYIVKPVELHVFLSIVQGIEGFWFTVVKLPPHAGE